MQALVWRRKKHDKRFVLNCYFTQITFIGKKHFGREICEKCETCKAREPSEKCATKKSQCAQIVLISFPQKNSTTAWCTPPPSSCWLHAEPVEKWKVWVARRPLARGGATQHQDVARDSSSRHLTPCTTRQIVSTSLHTFRSALKYEEYRQRVFIQHGCPGTSDTVRQWPVRFPNYQVPEVVVGEPD